MNRVLATGADERYGVWLLNMLGSLAANSPRTFDRVVAYDLGLNPRQRRLLDAVRIVEVQTVPSFVPHWKQGFTWKTWIWTHVGGDAVLWLDAGLTVLRPLDDIARQIDENGYFAVSQATPLSATTPSDYWASYGLSSDLGAQTAIAAGIFGFRTSGDFYDRVIVPTYEDCVAGRSLGFSANDVDRLRVGLYHESAPTIRDCTTFRWDQTVLNLRFYASVTHPVVNDLNVYAGFRSRRDSPHQVIWNHRRRGSLRYLPRVPYRAPQRLFGATWGAAAALRWWAHTHRWLLRPTTYSGALRSRTRR